MGVRISVADMHGLDMREFNFSSLFYADSYYRSSTVFTADYSPWADQFRGSGFKYNSDGVPIAGTATSYAILYNASQMVLVTGIAIAATKIVEAAWTDSVSDDFSIIRNALAGNDVINGGEFSNYLRGYDGNDVISGGQYDDKLFGEDGNDTLHGASNVDWLYGGDGNDVLNGGSYGDYLYGGTGTDTVSYSGASEGVTASLANAAANTQDASGDRYSSIENLTGTSYADRLEGNSSANVLTGGNGNDTLAGRGGADKLSGGSGSDTASYSGASAGVIASLTAPSGNTNDAAGDTYSSVENLTGTSFTDRLSGNSVANTLVGSAGDDTLVGYAGNDALYGGAGADRLFGGTGADRFVFKAAGESAASSFDSIFDFLASEDRIDLRAIDANAWAGADQAFSFIGTAAFSGVAGELRYGKLASDTYIYADVNGDKVYDLKIHLDDAVTLTDDYFLL